MATPKGYIFNAATARRVADVVRQVEGQPTSTTGKPVDTNPRPFARDLHVKIGTPRGPGKYDAVLLTPSEADEINPDAATVQEEVGAEHEPEEGITVVAINTAEIGTGTNGVEAGSVWPCSIVRRPTPDSPILFVSFSPGGGSLPTGQYMGMHFMTTSQNQSGWSFPFFGAFIG